MVIDAAAKLLALNGSLNRVVQMYTNNFTTVADVNIPTTIGLPSFVVILSHLSP